MMNIQKILKKVDRLQPIPTIVHKVLALAEDPDSDLADMIHLVKHDPALTADLLRICNSAYMGLPVKVDSIEQAVTMLGLQRVTELALAQSLTADMHPAHKGYGLQKGDLLKQSVATAMVARSLAERREMFNLPAIYTAALLKDIGKVVLHEFVAPTLAKIQDMVESRGLSFAEAEKKCIGMDHAELGGIIARKWNFSDHMVYMISNHHLETPEARNDPATATLYLSDMVAMMAGTCIGIDRLAYHVYEDVFEDYFLAKDELKALIITYEGFLKGIDRMFAKNNG